MDEEHPHIEIGRMVLQSTANSLTASHTHAPVALN
jgi:hypothetical protein